MWEFMVLLLLVAVLVVFLAPRFIRPGPRGALASGTLLVTGVSSREADSAEAGEQFVTISGVINGPTVNEHAVYRRMIVTAGQWPVTGQQFPVVYSPNNPDNWNFAPPEPPAPPEPLDG
ncbi:MULTISPECIES: hypothetical protein [unclassified Mycobacterium]|uniref:hypothetical protein n=1 Tax=unclassified Mycobacterium TaxID=2642494 RepID=UPI002741DDCC|nr:MULTISPECIES: hypothetical protein [unclassified Mycobacterium]MDP7703394.1 hypothetical protein [Mycobacterium sp. TY815]MDP7721877.1 hypothetical protein [Mycobacterium sp. TY814]